MTDQERTIPSRPIAPSIDYPELDRVYQIARADHEHAVAQVAVEALKDIINGDASRVRSPIGSIHAAGMITGWQHDCEIANKALALVEASGWRPEEP